MIYNVQNSFRQHFIWNPIIKETFTCIKLVEYFSSELLLPLMLSYKSRFPLFSHTHDEIFFFNSSSLFIVVNLFLLFNRLRIFSFKRSNSFWLGFFFFKKLNILIWRDFVRQLMIGRGCILLYINTFYWLVQFNFLCLQIFFSVCLLQTCFYCSLLLRKLSKFHRILNKIYFII